jgi:hypothetical protein
VCCVLCVCGVRVPAAARRCEAAAACGVLHI